MFNKISNIKYDIKLDNRPVESKNIFRFAYILDSYKDDPKNYLVHTIESDQTVESISAQYYGDAKYSWVILMYNNLLDVYEELPKTESMFYEYISKKYTPKNVLELKRMLPAPLLPKNGNTSFGNYNGQIVYDESIDRGVKWDSITQNWSPLPELGVPTPSSAEFNISCNNWNNPEESNHFLINGLTDPELVLFRGGTYKFKINFSPYDTFYLTTDDGKNYWNPNRFYGLYDNGISEKDFFGSSHITFKVHDDAPDLLYYSSDMTRPFDENNNRNMSNMIRIINLEDVPYVSQSDRNSLQNLNGRVMGKVVKIEDNFYVWNGIYTEPNQTNFLEGWNLLNPQSSSEYTIELGLLVAMQTPHKFTHKIEGYKITSDTYSALPAEEKNSYIMQSKYAYEEEKNEKNRTIRIMKKDLLGKFLENWERIVA